MKSLATINNLRSEMFKACRAYRQAVIQNLKEYGKELEVRGEAATLSLTATQLAQR